MNTRTGLYTAADFFLCTFMLVLMLCAVVLYVWLVYKLISYVIVLTGLNFPEAWIPFVIIGAAALFLWTRYGLRLWKKGFTFMGDISEYFDKKKSTP